MRISTRAQYALRAVLDVAHATDGDPIQLKVIAQRQAIPVAFLDRICRRLCQAGILRARRGCRGGYQIARPTCEITIGDVYRAVEGPRAFRLTTPERGAARRVSERLWSDLGDALARTLDSVTIETLCERADRGGVPRRGALPYLYAI